MAKKVVAKLKNIETKSFSKVIRMVKSPKTESYVFKEEVIPKELVNDLLSKKAKF